MANMELVESQSVLKTFFYRYIQEPFLKIKERWLAYFAGFAMDDDPSASDIETEIPSTETIQPNKERTRSIKPKVEERPRPCFGRFAFISTAMGTSFGLGHIWRFPNLAYKYGGGAFLVIYVVFTLLFGYSLHFMEVALGQYSSMGALRIFERVPLLAGVGYSIVAYGYVLSTYYSQVVSFGIYYFTSSFEPELPWVSCPVKESDVNETMCYTVKYPDRPTDLDVKCSTGVIPIDVERMCTDLQYQAAMRKRCCGKYPTCREFNVQVLCRRRQFPSAYYWTTKIIRQHAPQDPMRWFLDSGDLKILGCTLGAWFFIYVLVSVGIRWTGIITMAVYPFMLIAFLLMIAVAVGLEGSVNGIIEFFVPNLTDFTKSEIWYAALSHAFFSLGVAIGPSFTLGSFSKFRNPCHLDTLLISVSVILTSVLSGVVVYSMIGYTSDITSVVFDNASTKGSGTSIIAYSDILSRFPLPWLSSAIFFFLFTIMIAISVSCVIISTSHSISELSKILSKDRYIVNFLIVFSSFLLTLPMVLREGLIIFSCLDNFTMRVTLPIICMFEIIAFFVYGIHILSEDITFMTGSRPSRYYKYCFILCPLVVIGAFVYKFVDLEVTRWLHWTKLTQLAISAIILCPILFVMIGNILKYSVTRNMKEIVRRPTKAPARTEELQLLRMEFKISQTIF